MNITTGLFDHMVLQRNSKDVCEAKISGTIKKPGKFKVSVKHYKKKLKNVTIELTSLIGLEFQAIIIGIPAGGAYNLKIVVKDETGETVDSIKVKDVLVGDVWMLAGQSNMQGIGYMKDALKPDPLTRAFYVTDNWGIAKDPLHQLHLAVDDVHVKVLGAGKDSPHIGVGPGVPFAQEMHKIHKIPQGVIAAAHGGTTMTQWSPALKKDGGRSLYGAMLRRFVKNGSKIAGVLWYQGCSDTNPDAAAVYTQKMVEFVKEVRKDFKSPSLPFAIVQISRVCGGVSNAANTWNDVQNQQRLLPKSIKNLSVVAAIDLSLDDGIHISGFDNIRLGKRLAQAMTTLKFNSSDFLPPIEFKSVKLVQNKITGSSDFVITFNNVMGKLEALGRPHGFEITDNLNNLSNYQIYRTDLDGNKVILKTGIPFVEASFKYLYYGYGIMPYCNITDSNDRSLPVLGPVKIKNMGTCTPFIHQFLVSDFQPSAGKLENLNYPANQKSHSFHEHLFNGNFCDLHPEIARRSPEDNVIYYKTNLVNALDMSLKLHIGYDGPIKIWVDKNEVLFDPKGKNPALIDEKSIPLNLAKGTHEVIIALGTNSSKAWGIFLRFECLEPKTFDGLDLDEALRFQI